MKTEWKSNSSGHVLSVSGAVRIGAVNELRPEFLKVLKKKQKVTIDLSGIDDCDTAGVQLLYSFFYELQECNKKVSLSGVSQAVFMAVDAAALSVDSMPILNEEI